MSQDFKFKFDEMRGNDPTASADEDGSNSGNGTKYEAVGHVRNIGFAWPDGRKLFLNYSYLISAELKPAGQVIELAFTSHKVRLEGIRLEVLFEELMEQMPRLIVCVDKRYNATYERETVINEISVEQPKST